MAAVLFYQLFYATMGLLGAAQASPKEWGIPALNPKHLLEVVLKPLPFNVVLLFLK
jgi:hypothetical protein